MKNKVFNIYISILLFLVLLTANITTAFAASETYISPTCEQDTPLWYLAHLICGEAQNCDDLEQQYVASVVINRVNSSLFPNSIYEVIFQPGQYACTWDGNYYREPTINNYRNAQHILDYGSILPGNVLYQAAGVQGDGEYMRTSYHVYSYQN